jgi:hypothetical protein
MPYRKNILKVFFVVVLLALVIAQPVSAQDRCHAHVNKVAGSCVYDGSSSTWQVKITLYGYMISFQSDPTNLTFANPYSWNVDYTISLTAGTYTYDKWEWKGYWEYKGTGTLSLETCVPPDASASVSLGTCHPGDQGSVSDVNLVIDHATLLINGSSYSASTSISLAPGSYPWSWTAQSGYWGSGSGTLEVGTCSLPDADASVTLGACHPGEDGSESDVSILIDHAILTINGQDYSASADISLPPGIYPWSWVAQSGYAGSGSGTLEVGTCELPEANASVSLDTCYPGEPGTESVSDVDLSVSHAELQINGNTYTSSQTISLGPGSYPWSWTAESGYTGSDSGTLVVGDCSPKYQAEFQFDVGTCAWGGDVFERDVELTIDGASVVITGSAGSFGPYTSSQTIKLPCGDYTYAWSAADPAYEGSGSGELSLPECDQSKADAAANIGACTYGDGESLTVVDIIVENAIFTIDGKSYSENTLLKLLPGDYVYSWGPVSGEFSGSGEGVLTVGACAPKEEKEEDPSVDVAAGGSAPSLLVSVTPLMALIGSLGVAWMISEQTKVRKTK